jgi:hypothetical protein
LCWLIRDLIQEGGWVPQLQTISQGRQTPWSSQPAWLNVRHSKHWACVCSVKNKEMRVEFRYPHCNMGLCVSLFFQALPHKLHFWKLSDTLLEIAEYRNVSKTKAGVSILLSLHSISFLM